MHVQLNHIAYYFAKHEERGEDMIVMDLKVDNFYAFKDFHMNMSYPKKIVNSLIDGEFLEDRSNFRYKKVNILMGGNASGKTTTGKILNDIFVFLQRKTLAYLVDTIRDNSKKASFSIDFINGRELDTMYRVSAVFHPSKKKEYDDSTVNVVVQDAYIGKSDNYETVAAKMKEPEDISDVSSYYVEELEKVDSFGWMFSFPIDGHETYEKNEAINPEFFVKVLDHMLRTLDSSIEKVEELKGVEEAYIIRRKYGGIPLLIQNGKVIDSNYLSSGTRAGINIAEFLTGICEGKYGFHYCDEKFSYIHSEIEKSVLALMISMLRPNQQLFFTSHNMDILDMPLPKHTFSFMRKDEYTQYIECIDASSILKRNTDSLRNAAENDVFSSVPNTELIFDLEDICTEYCVSSGGKNEKK